MCAKGPKVTFWSPRSRALENFCSRLCQSPQAKGVTQHKAVFMYVFIIPKRTHPFQFCPLVHPPATMAKVWEHSRTHRGPLKRMTSEQALLTELAKEKQNNNNSDLGGPLFRHFSCVFADDCVLALTTSRGLLLNFAISTGLSVANTLLALCKQLKVHLQKAFKNQLQNVSLH